jgi:peptide-methionine (R)-S-oxide reductase
MVSRRTFSLTTLASATALLVGRTEFAGATDESAASSKEVFAVNKTPDEWKKALTKEQYYVLRDHGTERAFTSPLDKNYAPGDYNCAGCGTKVFTADTKFDSGTGWPSFWKPVENAIATRTDKSFFTTRTEVHCATCGGHLGHVFEDGPKPTGLRYCMNGVAMTFKPATEKTADSKS